MTFMMNGDTFTISVLGCKVNQYNSQLIRENLSRAGFRETGSGRIRIVAGCVVTERAEQKSRKVVNRAVKSGAGVIVTGCYAGRHGIRGAASVSDARDVVRKVTGRDDFVQAISSFSPRTRAFLKVQEGCSGNCAYCIVPAARGKPRSRERDEVLREAENLARTHPEIVLTGTHLGLYGAGEDGNDLAGLVEKILEKTDGARIRLSSIEVNEITPRLLGLFSRPALCPHLHIPLQSGSDRVLGLMNRPYDNSGFMRAAERIRSASPKISITTDVMVGFPGEKDRDFRETLKTVDSAGFLRVHAFPFSPRKGTPAFNRGDNPGDRVKKLRMEALRETAEKTSFRVRKGFLGRERTVIAERRERNGGCWGYSEDYIRIFFEPESRVSPGSICRMRISGVDEHATRGRVLELMK